jgi:hypothetical protein
MVSHEPPAPLRRYELTEIRIKGKVIDTSTSSGSLSVEQVPQSAGSLMVYRLDGGRTPDKARTFVRSGTTLRQADPARLELARAEMGFTLAQMASTSAERIEIGDALLDLMNWSPASIPPTPHARMPCSARHSVACSSRLTRLSRARYRPSA